MALKIYCSTVDDGSMKSLGGDQATARANRVKFLEKNYIDPSDTTLHTLSYGGNNYCRYIELSAELKGDGILSDSSVDADAVVITTPRHAILLPLADCVGAVIHDPQQDILMVSHLGRHNLEQHGGTKCIEYLVKNFAIDPVNLNVWLSPAAGSDNYPLHSFNNRSMYDVAIEQITRAGVLVDRITSTNIDTTTDEKYFSHSEFLKHHQDTDGRFAIVAMMNP